ncbi:MAG: hypothetical protein RL371_589 [Bacteroidota bacterium]
MAESEGLRYACSPLGGLLAIAREPIWGRLQRIKKLSCCATLTFLLHNASKSKLLTLVKQKSQPFG